MAGKDDISGWMKLAGKVKDDFPGFEEEEHRRTVLEFMERREAICAEVDGRTSGILLFSRKDSMLCFLAVDPGFRRQHIAEKMVTYMLTFLDKDVAVTTYREDAPEGMAARAFYIRMGFVPGRLTEGFGCPVQEFVLKRKQDGKERKKTDRKGIKTKKTLR